MGKNTNTNISRSCKLILMSFLSSLLLIVSACDSSTSPKTGTINGIVILVNDTDNPDLDPVDFSGVTVTLYALALLDTALVNSMNLHSAIGFPVSQQTEFDHFYGQSLRSASTNAGGHFLIDGIQPGTYNIVISKEGWGYSYLLEHDVTVVNNDNSLNITLYPETTMASVITESSVFKADHIYRFSSDCITTQECNLTIERGATLILDEGTSFDIYGGLSVVGDENEYIRIISSGAQARFNRFSIQPSAYVIDNNLSGIIISRSVQGLLISHSNIELRYIRGNNSVSSISLQSASGISVANVVVTDCDGVDTGSIQLYGSSNFTIANSILISNTQAIKFRVSANGVIENVAFINNSEYDINNNDQSDGLIIKWCDFIGSNTALWNTYHSTAIISYCNFESIQGVINDNGRNSMVQVNNCNFACSDYAIKTRVYYYGNTDELHIDASMNYWGTTSESEIQQLIWDRFDESPDINYYEFLLGVVDYQPYLTRSVTSAGVQN